MMIENNDYIKRLWQKKQTGAAPDTAEKNR